MFKSLLTGFVLLSGLWGQAMAQEVIQEKLPDLSKQVVVNASLEDAWASWVTEEGLEFISRRSNVELAPGGSYEWFLDLEPDEFGRRGGEGARLLVVMPHDLLAFTWRFPPSVMALRRAEVETQVVVRFEALDDQRTRVRLDVSGWGSGPDWQDGHRYFDNAWDVVLSRFAGSFNPVNP